MSVPTAVASQPKVADSGVDQAVADLVRRHLHRPGPEPQYSRMVNGLEEAIDRGMLPRQSELPSEASLAAVLGVGVAVVKHAVSRLVERGTVLRRPGLRARVLGPQSGLSGGDVVDELQMLSATRVERRVLVHERSAAPDVCLSFLGISSEESVLVERRLFRGKSPVAVLCSWLPITLAVQLDEMRICEFGLYAALAVTGRQPVAGTEELGAQLATEQDVRTGGFSAGEALLVASRQMYDAQGRPLEVAIHTYSAAEFSAVRILS